MRYASKLYKLAGGLSVGAGNYYERQIACSAAPDSLKDRLNPATLTPNLVSRNPPLRSP